MKIAVLLLAVLVIVASIALAVKISRAVESGVSKRNAIAVAWESQTVRLANGEE